MLEHVPAAVGKALQGVRPGPERLTINKHFADVSETIGLSSTMFEHGSPMPADVSEDGRKLSPPLAWRGVPPGCAEIILVVEDADSPTPEPLVHAIVLGLPGQDGSLAQGALLSTGSAGEGHKQGKTSFLKADFLPPDPPAGHGPHRYAFQIFALDRPAVVGREPGRGAVVEAMKGHVVAKGLLIGTYERT